MDNREFFYRAKRALQEQWWQSTKPTVASVGRELSAVKQWRERVSDDEALIAALESYDGDPISFLWAHKRGNRGLVNRLLAKARQRLMDEVGR